MEEREPYREDWWNLKQGGQWDKALTALKQNYAIALDREDLFWADTFFQEIIELLRLQGRTKPVEEAVDVVRRFKDEDPRLNKRSELMEQNLEDNLALIRAKTGLAEDRLKDIDRLPED